jgi:hypothetical protein
VDQGWVLEIFSECLEDGDDQFSANIDQLVQFPIVGRILICDDRSLFIEVFCQLLGLRIETDKTFFAAESHISGRKSM